MKITKTHLSIILVFGIFIITACSTPTGTPTIEVEPTTSQTPEPSATPEPTHTLTPTNTATFTPTSTDTRTPTPTNTPTPEPLTQEDLQSALLRLDDFPAGWTEAPEDDQDDDEDDTFDFLCKEFNRTKSEKASVEFQKSELGPMINHTIVQYPTGQAGDQFAAFQEAVEECSEFENSDPVLKWKVSPMSFPKLGEQSFAFHADIEFSLGLMQIESVYYLIGDTISNIRHLKVGASEIDSQLTEDFAKIAEQRLLDTIENR